MYNVHDHLKHLTVEELKEVSNQDRLPFSVCLLNLEHDLNIGNCIRSAHILGAKRVFIFGKSKYDSRSTVGSHNYIDVQKITLKDIEDRDEVSTRFSEMIKDNRLSPMMIDKTERSTSIYSNYFKSYAMYADILEPCLIFGNEGNGIPNYLMEYYPHFHIPQRGVIRSMNVSSAASIVIHEFSRIFYKDDY